MLEFAKRLTLLSVLLLSFTSHADSSEGDVSEASYYRNNCSRIYNPTRCDELYNCYWSHRYDTCMVNDGRDDDDYARSCYEVRSLRACNYRRDCQWNYYYDSCENNRQDSGRRCYHIQNRYQCERNRSCHWSNAFDRCVGPNDY